MASEIRVTNIKANDGTASLTVADSTGNVSVGGTLTSSGAITASGGIANAGTISAGTLGSNIVFPDGKVTNILHRRYVLSSNNDFSNQSGGGSNVHRIMNRESSSSAVVPSFTARQGYTYQVIYSFYGYTDQNAGVNSSGRRTEWKLYYGTTSRSQNDSTFDTLLEKKEEGRNSASATTAQAGDYHGVVLTGAWYQSGADATTYVYITGNATDNGKRVYIAFKPTTPMHLYITEYKGNVLTTVT